MICPEKGIIGTPDSLTDGVWTWHADLSYYVDKYNLILDDSFLNHIKSNMGIVPQDIEIDYDDIQFI